MPRTILVDDSQPYRNQITSIAELLLQYLPLNFSRIINKVTVSNELADLRIFNAYTSHIAQLQDPQPGQHNSAFLLTSYMVSLPKDVTASGSQTGPGEP